MLCFYSQVSLLLLFLLFSLPCNISTNDHANMKLQSNKNTNMVPSERETLFKIMETISSDKNWRISHPNPCIPGSPSSSWFGLECKLGQDNLYHVSRLDFGTSPNPKCMSTAVFPKQIFDLPYLQSVFFFNCFTHTKTTLSVSQNTNSSLQQLSLRSNPSLVGQIPRLISSVKSLKILTLSQNRLTGLIPVEIFRLISLVHLDLSYNMLSGIIPYQVGDLKNLVGLDLSYNLLTGTIPRTIGQLGQLQKLDLSLNALTGTMPDSIENLSSLIFMALSNNQFFGNFPKGISKLQSLQYVIMDDNPMMSIPLPSVLGELVKLQELRLANSAYFGTIPPSFSNLLNLTTLSLQNNLLTGEIPVSLSNLSHIYHLNLSRNLLSGVVPFNASFLSRLGRNLDLGGNPGLCLSPSEATANFVKIGVSVCGRNTSTGSLAHTPLKKSEATFVFSGSLFFFNALCVTGFHYILLSI